MQILGESEFEFPFDKSAKSLCSTLFTCIQNLKVHIFTRKICQNGAPYKDVEELTVFPG